MRVALYISQIIQDPKTNIVAKKMNKKLYISQIIQDPKTHILYHSNIKSCISLKLYRILKHKHLSKEQIDKLYISQIIQDPKTLIVHL